MGRRGLTRSSHPITFTLALVLVACGGTNTAPSTTTAAAAAATEPEGQVVIAASPELFSSRLIADFAAKSGCHATLVPPAVDGVVPAGVDLIELRSDQVSAFTASGTTRSPAVPDSIPQSLRVPGAMPYLWEAELLAVPDGSVQRPSLRVLFAPGRSGSVALPDSPSMLALVARYLGAAKPFRLTAEQLASVRRLLTLAPPRLYTSRERLQQLFTTSTPVVVVSSAETGVIPVTQLRVPAEGSIGAVRVLLSATDSLHPQCAKAFSEYILRPEPQAALSRTSNRWPVVSSECDPSIVDRCRFARQAQAHFIPLERPTNPDGSDDQARWVGEWTLLSRTG